MGKSKSKSRTVSKAVVKEVETRSTSTNGRNTYLFVAVALLSLIGLADAIYLTVQKMTGGIVQCGLSNCEDVLNSRFATIAGIPLAAFGALAYFIVFSLATLTAFGNERTRGPIFYVVALMLAFSIWLFYLQAFVLHAFCQFCLLSGGITLLISILVALDRFYFKRKYVYR